jgi:hypothetical protein
MGFTEIGRAALADRAKTVRYLVKNLVGWPASYRRLVKALAARYPIGGHRATQHGSEAAVGRCGDEP